MFALIAASSTFATRATLPRLRLRLRFLFASKWRLPCLRRSTLPVPVILNRLETAFLVLAIPAFLDIRGSEVNELAPNGNMFFSKS